MIIPREGQRLYLSTWDYNRCRLMTALEKIVKHIGGEVAPCCKFIISNRDVDEDKTIQVTQSGSIQFVVDDMWYTYSTTDNPLFDFHYAKSPVIYDRVSKDIYYDTDNARVYAYSHNSGDCIFYGDELSDTEIKSRAMKLLEFLLGAAVSEKIPPATKHVAVANTYNGGTHIEVVHVKAERFEELTWLSDEKEAGVYTDFLSNEEVDA